MMSSTSWTEAPVSIACSRLYSASRRRSRRLRAGSIIMSYSFLFICLAGIVGVEPTLSMMYFYGHATPNIKDCPSSYH